MNLNAVKTKKSTSWRKIAAPRNFFTASCCLLLLLAVNGCKQIQSPEPEPFVGKVAPPRRQELRWSNGKMPKSLDPARAAAAPETDIVRAVYEGLTDVDPKTLQPVPGIAAKWSASEDYKTWTFSLRRDAKWSNGAAVTAQDFARSWKRLAELGERTAQRELLKNIVGMDTENVLPIFANEELDKAANFSENESASRAEETVDESSGAASPEKTPFAETVPAPAADKQSPPAASASREPKPAQSASPNAKFGVEAVDKYTLKITLAQPDRQFPALVAHPIFRPVYGDGENLENLNQATVTNGAFRLAAIEKDGLTLERAPDYWNKERVALERVRFVPTENAERALEAYRAGQIDAITNANLEPLALKLLAPYDDFRRSKHGALNYYEFNLQREIFKDRRVREALAVAIDRARLTEGEMAGATVPALRFSPFETTFELSQDAEKGRQLLAEAGYAGGANFPAVRLLVNRNNVQQRIARAVAAMWKKNLKIETEIIVKDQSDYENAAQIGDYDIIRRGAVLPTTDETANMLNMFSANEQITPPDADDNGAAENQILSDQNAESKLDFSKEENSPRENAAQNQTQNLAEKPEMILTEADALRLLPAIPLYFPTSYSLVKPYVQGFEMNQLDAVSLKDVRIDSDWQPPAAKSISNNQN